MKEAIVLKTGEVVVSDVEVPVPAPGQVLIKCVVSGTNPKDWKYPEWIPDREQTNQGDDIAGYVEAVGEGVLNFRPGDKVAAFHEMHSPHGSYAEYAIAWETTTFRLPPQTSFEEAATIPLAAMTASLALYQRLGLPLPWNPTVKPLPLVIYGGATAVGAYAIKLASLSGIHPIIAVTGKGAPFVETLIDRSKGDAIVDYRKGDEAVRKGITEAAGGLPIHYAFDAVSEHGSYMNAAAVLTKPGNISTVLPADEKDVIPDGITLEKMIVNSVNRPPRDGKKLEDREFGAVFFPFLGRGLAQGWFSGHPHEVRPGGLGALEGVLRDLKAGKASAVKYVVRIGETQGVSQKT